MSVVDTAPFVVNLVPAQQVFEWGTVDLVTGATRAPNGAVIYLTKRETQILLELARHVDEIVSHDTLLDVDYLLGDEPQAARVWISRLRAKIGDTEKRYIVKHHGLGYRLVRGTA